MSLTRSLAEFMTFERMASEVGATQQRRPATTVSECLRLASLATTRRRAEAPTGCWCCSNPGLTRRPPVKPQHPAGTSGSAAAMMPSMPRCLHMPRVPGRRRRRHVMVAVTCLFRIGSPILNDYVNVGHVGHLLSLAIITDMDSARSGAVRLAIL